MKACNPIHSNIGFFLSHTHSILGNVDRLLTLLRFNTGKRSPSTGNSIYFYISNYGTLENATLQQVRRSKFTFHSIYQLKTQPVHGHGDRFQQFVPHIASIPHNQVPTTSWKAERILFDLLRVLIQRKAWWKQLMMPSNRREEDVPFRSPTSQTRRSTYLFIFFTSGRSSTNESINSY